MWGSLRYIYSAIRVFSYCRAVATERGVFKRGLFCLADVTVAAYPIVFEDELSGYKTLRVSTGAAPR